MDKYPAGALDYGSAIAIIPHRSWERKDQIRLARHYLQRIPFAHGAPYAAFLSFMSVPVFIDVIREHLPRDKGDLSLLMYYLRPALLSKAVTETDKDYAARFLDQILALIPRWARDDPA